MSSRRLRENNSGGLSPGEEKDLRSDRKRNASLRDQILAIMFKCPRKCIGQYVFFIEACSMTGGGKVRCSLYYLTG